jgi:SAM-dependent methyltransferase
MSHGTSYWPWLKDVPVLNGVHLLGPTTEAATLYGIVRGAEGRMLTDDQVRALPQGKGLWNASEWSLRTRSTARLLKVLASQGSGLRILEVGCGNGWLTAALQRNGHHVLGLDPFTAELEQAARVFHDGPTFARGDLLTTTPHHFWDTAVAFALAAPLEQLWLIFTALGIGMSLPWLLIAAFPVIANSLRTREHGC